VGLGVVYDFTKPLTKGDIFSIVSGLLGVASALILAYGGFTRNSKAMQIYIYSTIFLILLFIGGAIWAVVEVANAKEELINETCNEYRGTSNYQVCLNAVNNEFDKIGPIGLIFVVVIAVATILFDIWTIFVAKNAKKEIEAEKWFHCIQTTWKLQGQNYFDYILIVLNRDTFLKTWNKLIWF